MVSTWVTKNSTTSITNYLNPIYVGGTLPYGTQNTAYMSFSIAVVDGDVIRLRGSLSDSEDTITLTDIYVFGNPTDITITGS